MSRFIREAVAFIVVGVVWLVPGMAVGVVLLLALTRWG